MNNTCKGLALVVLAASAQVSYAQNRAAPQAAEAGWYMGGSVGRTNTKFTNVDFAFNEAGTTESKDNTKTGGKGFVGYDFNKNWGIEGGYTSLGKPEYKYAGRSNGRDSQTLNSWSLAAKGTLPLNNQFDLFAKLGVTNNKASSSTTTSGVTVLNLSASKNRSDVLAGVGAAYNFDRNFSLRLEYENYGKFGNQVTQGVAVPVPGQTGRSSTDMWSVGVSYKF